MSRRLLLLALIIIISLIVFKYNKADYIPTDYEQKVINYFKEVNFNLEFEDNPTKTIKWQKVMKLYLYRVGSERQLNFVENAINKINNLILDGFKIELTENPKKSNSFLYLCNRNKLKELAPKFYNVIDDTFLGMAYTELNASYNIDRAFIFVDTEESIDAQESTILEELTQSIGLLNDSETYPDSIFYENKSDNDINIYEYSKLDKDVIKLLYHPKMKSGLNERQAERTILKILKEKEIRLTGAIGTE